MRIKRAISLNTKSGKQLTIKMTEEDFKKHSEILSDHVWKFDIEGHKIAIRPTVSESGIINLCPEIEPKPIGRTSEQLQQFYEKFQTHVIEVLRDVSQLIDVPIYDSKFEKL